MLIHYTQCDVTGTVDLARQSAVADAVCEIIGRRHGGIDEALIRRGFADIEDIFRGRLPGFLPCDTPYHDLRHSLDTALLTARMLDGCAATQGTHALGHDECELAVLLALFHDIGFIRRADEAHLRGAELLRDHEQRSVDFMRSYLAATPLAGLLAQVELIHTTNIARPLALTLADLPPQLAAIGRIIGTADLVSQMADRFYLERCRDFLYREFVDAGADRVRLPSGEISITYRDGEDLLRQTPAFFEHLVKKRLDGDLEQAYRYVATHFDGADPYWATLMQNLAYLRTLIERGDLSALRRRPEPLIPR